MSGAWPQAGFFACELDAWLAASCGVRSPQSLARGLVREQWAALARTLRRAAGHSALYARRLRGCNLSPSGPEALAELPFTTADDLHPWENILCVPLGEVERMVTLRTSGTTGHPKRLAFTAKDLARTRDFFAVGMARLVQPGQRLAVLLPGAQRPHSVADLLRQALEPGGVEVLSPPPECLEAGQEACLAENLLRADPHCLVALPAQLARLPDFLPEGLPRLAGILSSGEPLPPETAAKIRVFWKCELLDHYGLTETGYGCAVECPAHNGRHLRALDVLVEIVDTAHGRVLPWGEEGEVVVTTLNREAMPLIRYRTGDVASLLPGPCACGSPLPRLGPVAGRIVRDGPQGRLRIVAYAKGGA